MQKKYFILLLACTLLLACSNDNTCKVTNDIALQIGFYSDTLDSTGAHHIFASSFDTLSVWGVGNDSILYDSVRSVNTIKLPLQTTTTTTQYVVATNNTTDTLIITHSNNDLFVSLQCGCFTLHTIEEIGWSGHLFDSVEYIEYEIGRLPTENIRLYWH